jgi:hypothetical protein
MLANLSLASLAQCIKYKLLCDDYHSTLHRKKTSEEEEKENVDNIVFF